MSKSKIIFGLLVLSTLILFFYVRSTNIQTIRINEVAYSLDSGVDWIEIYNPTINNISLSGFYLTDKEDKFSKFKIPDDTVIEAGGYLIIYCKNFENESGNYVVTNFNLSDGEVLYLIDRDGSSIVDRFPLVTDDLSVVIDSNFSLSRIPNGNGEIIVTNTLTPNSINTSK